MIPKNREENKKWRAQVLSQNDAKTQAMLYEKCKRDWEFFINGFCWTYDPRLSTPHIPFILYPKQVELIKFLEKMLAKSRKGEQVAVIIDKPRDVGATFTCMTWGLWHYLFGDFSIRVGSRTEKYVDQKGEADTLFFKVDYNLKKMPSFLLPEGFSFNRNRKAMILSHPQNSNAISGESANPNFGRGGRKSAILFDELGFWDWSRSSWESAGESTNFRIAMSTPPEEGRDSHFYKLRTGQRGKVYQFNFEWTDVPSRDKNWFSEKKENKSEAEFAREVMKSYEGTTENKVYASDIKHSRFSDVDYNPELPLYIAWDFGLDAVSMIWLQKDAMGQVYVIDAYENSSKEIGFYVPFVTGSVISGYDYTDQDLEVITRHKNWSQTIEHFGDPSVRRAHVSTGRSTRDELSDKYNIFIQSKDFGSRTWSDLKDLTKPLFRRLKFNEIRCEYLISCLRNARFPVRRANTQATTESQKPVHDWTSHFRSTLEFFADNEPGHVPSQSIQSGPVVQEDSFNDDYEQYYVI